jgi:hypothetical protein
MIEKHKTGAATLLTSILAKAATNMLAIRTVLGLVPALLRTNVAIRLSILVFDRAAATVNPPNKSIITGVHIAEKTYAVAAFESSRLFGGSSDRTTFNTTHKKGMINEVTKRGMACTLLIN